MLQLSADDLQSLRNAAHDKQIFLVVGKSTLSGIQYLNFLLETLETLQVSYLYDCQPPPSVPDINIIAQAVEDAVRFLGVNQKSFYLLFSDAAKYMLAAGATLESLYPKLFDVTYVLLAKNRTFVIKNVKQYMILHFNSCT